MDEYYDKITGNPKYALHGMCNPLMIWQQRKAETDGLDAYKARNIYYHSIFDDLVKINNRIIVDEPTLRRGLNGCCVPGKKRLYVTATGEYKACERIGSSPSIGNVDEGVDRELIVKKYVEEFAAQSKDISDKCWAYNLCRVCYAGVCNENGLDMGLKNEACRASRSVALNNLALYHELMEENPEALRKGFANLKIHLENLAKFGVPAVTAINRFATDSTAEITLLQELCAEAGVTAVTATCWENGGKGALALAFEVCRAVEKPNGFGPLYDDNLQIKKKISLIAKEIYRAGEVTFSDKALSKLAEFESQGYKKHFQKCNSDQC